MTIFDLNKWTLFILACLWVVLYTLCGAIYRLYLHPLAKIPGPTLAALTHWFEFYHDVVGDGTFIWIIDQMHERYGPIVRITPDEVHINDPDMFDTIYSGSGQPRDKDPRFCMNAVAPYATIAAPSHALHKQRRAALNPFFSKRSIMCREQEIKDKVNKLCERLETDLASGNTIQRMDCVYNALTTDVITDFAFGVPYGLLDRDDYGVVEQETITQSERSLALLRHFPWLTPLLKATPLWVMELARSPMAGLLRYQNQVALKVDELFEKNRHGVREDKSIFQAILDSDARPAHEKQSHCLQDEAQSVTGAGSETTAKSLALLTYFVLADKSILTKLREELQTVPLESDESYSLANLEKLPYLSGCINEAIRLTLGITTRSARIAHEPIPYLHYLIPAGTPMSSKNSVLNWNSSIYPNPFKFDPSRWVDAHARGEHLEHRLASFSKGSRGCVGINLAYAELYLVTAHILGRFEMDNYETTWEADVRIAKDWFVGAPRDGSKGIRARLTGLVESTVAVEKSEVQVEITEIRGSSILQPAEA